MLVEWHIRKRISHGVLTVPASVERDPGVPGLGVELDVEWRAVGEEADPGPAERGFAGFIAEGAIDGARELVAGLETTPGR